MLALIYHRIINLNRSITKLHNEVITKLSDVFRE